MSYPRKAFVNKTESSVVIGNANIVREISINGGKVKTTSLLNRRTDGEIKFCPSSKSEEFVISINKKFGAKLILRSRLFEISDVQCSEDENGAKAEILFKAYDYGKARITVKLIFEVMNNRLCIDKYLDISSDDGKKLDIDYIDLEYFELGSDVKQRWSRPKMKKAYLTEFQSALGQPIYINGMYLGCEFPATDNNIENNIARIRYYSGKTLESMCKGENHYSTWKTVFGAARSLDMEVIRADFLEYITSISQPLYLRTQYNSWFDHMLEIDDKKIRDSFFEIEKGLTQYGVPPVNSYVVDDGWVDYDKDFWCFNSKFPNELHESSALAKKFSSDFGLWLGPRGGYNSKTSSFGKRMQKSGKGGHNKLAKDVCVADHRYIKNITDFFIDYMDRFDINYWKLDGFLLRSCKNKHHGHPTGGYENMYCFTDNWESWLKVFTDMRAFRAKQGKDLWLNQTSYCNASPWYLAYSESLWMQNSSDVDFIDKTKSGEKLCGKDYDKMLTYRDSRYFDFHKTRQYQFPLSNMYNHEPIYGNTAKIKMTDDEFRKYMFMISTRGTAFWELYYSFNLFTDDMWRINMDVLRFIRENFEILRNAKLIGNSPDTGSVYGYSAWNGKEGIVSLRNPANREQEFSVTLDRIIGVGENASGMTCAVVLPYTEKVDSKIYNYGDELKITLAPHEIIIYKFSNADSFAPSLMCAKFIDNDTVEFRFDKRITVNQNSFTADAKPLAPTLMANYSDVRVNIDGEKENGKDILVDCNVFDIYGNEFKETVSVTYYKDLIIPVETGILGTGDFTIKFVLDNAPDDGIIFTQGKELYLKISNGKPIFELKGITAKSDTVVSGKKDVEIKVTRERNGMVKLYIDGILDCSGYNEARANAAVISGEFKKGSSLKSISFLNKALDFKTIGE